MRIRSLFAGIGMLCAFVAPAFAATLLPNGETVFLDNNGAPLASGTVSFYIPNTLVPKDTWQNAGQTVLNTNPITLDTAGRAIIYGSGDYRQIVKDSLGNVIWDQQTADTSPSTGTAWGGTSGGTPNAQTVSAPAFVSGNGQSLVFIAGATNTGATTVNPNGSGAINVFKETPSGPAPLTGGEIVTGNLVDVIYDGSQFQLINGSGSGGSGGVGPLTNLASGATTDLGTIASQNVNITGSNTITSFGSSASTDFPIYRLRFPQATPVSATITIASPAVITAANTYVAGQAVQFATTGALPTGLTAGTTYYVIATGLSTSSFEVSATVGGAAVNTSGSQSGTHTVTSAVKLVYDANAMILPAQVSPVAVSISVASPAVVTATNNFAAGQTVQFFSTGTLPTGITAGQTYYVISAGLSTSSFEVSATPGGTAVNTSGAPSGTQTMTAALNIQTQANDAAQALYLGSGRWQIVSFNRNSGSWSQGTAGALPYFNNVGMPAILPAGTNGQSLQMVAGLPAFANTVASNYQSFSSTGTWTKPTGITSASVTHLRCWGAGGGGGSNANGGGGGGGAFKEVWLNTSDSSPKTVTITIASPAVVTYNNTFQAGQTIQFQTTGSLPSGITAGNNYYVISAGLSATQFEFSATVGGAAVNTTGSQGGTQTITTALGATETVTIPTGGAVNAAGGTATFGNWLTAYGGGAGASAASGGGGGGGGQLSTGSAGSSAVGGAGGSPLGGTATTSTGGDGGFGGGAGGSGTASGSAVGGAAVWGGGGGSSGAQAGGASVFGGGGGGGNGGTGGASTYGGAGGASTVAGQQPGGGGGRNAAGGAGFCDAWTSG